MSELQDVASLKVYLLGSPRIERDGAPVQVDTRKAIALLAYLALESGAHSREVLAALLWPDYEPARAYANLRRTLWTLNRALGKAWLDVEGESVALRRQAGLWLDVEAFRRYLDASGSHGHGEADICQDCLGPLAAAGELYRQSFLAGFALRDSAPFDEWQFFQAEGLSRELAHALERLGRCYAERGEFQPALACTRRWLALDPLHEPAHRRLMELYAWSGQRAAALRQYQECARILDEELGLPPDEETEELHRANQSGKLPPPPGGATEQAEGGLRPVLPISLAPFVGRSQELAEIRQRLQKPECRLLTLVGPGGIGKTRLAQQIAIATLEDDPPAGGVYHVALAPVESPAHLTSAIAEGLGFAFYEREGESPEQQLLGYLADKQMLLVLDNLEHLLDGTGLVSELLSSAPEVKVLATSRERLNLPGEWLFEVRGMRVPETGTFEAGTLESPERYSAVRLFLQRVRMVQAGFAPSAAEMDAVVRICRLVDGMPLGIELAAAWARTLSVGEIGDEIQRSLDFLTSSARGAPERHRSLRAVCDHSWQLLTGAERRAFRRLSVFRGGFDRQAAAEVAGADLPLLQALLDKSLVRRGADGRYFLHEVLRQFAADKLAADSMEAQATRDQHSRYFTRFLHVRLGDLKGRRQIEALDEMAAEVENVRVAWRWAAERCLVPELLQAAESLFHFSHVRKGFAEGEQAFAEAVQALESAHCQATCRETGQETERELALGSMLAFQGSLARFWRSKDEAHDLIQRGVDMLRPLGRSKELALAQWLAVIYQDQGDPAIAGRMVQDSLEIFREIGDRSGVARCLYALAFDVGTTRADQVRQLHESLAISREDGDRLTMALTLFALGEIAHVAGEFAESSRYFQQCLDLRREIGDRQGIGIGCDYLGYVVREMGEYDEARRLHQESLLLSEEIGDRLGIAGSFDNLGLVARDLGDYEEARTLFGQGLAIRREIATGWETAASLEHLGTVSLALGEVDRATQYLQESLDLARDAIWPMGTAQALIGLSDVLALRGEGAQACQHAASALMLGGLIENRMTLLEVLVCAARRLLEVGRVEPAVQVLDFVVHDPSSSHAVRSRAKELLAEVVASLPGETLSAALHQDRDCSPEQIAERVQELLEAIE